MWAELGRSLWRILIPCQLLRVNCVDILFNSVGVDSHTLHYHLYKAQVTEDSRRAIGQRWTTTPTKGTTCVKDGHCYCVRVCSILAALRYRLVSLLLCTAQMVLSQWLHVLSICCQCNVLRKLSHKSLHLFHFL